MRSITDYKVAEPEVELVAPKVSAGQEVSGREYADPIPVGRRDVASAPSDVACTNGKDTGYYSRSNVRASGALYDIRLPIGVIANLKEGAVEAIWWDAVWSKTSGKVLVFLSTTGEKWSISDSIMVLQSFGGEPVPVEHSLALQAELAARAAKQLAGRGLKRAHDEPAEPRATPPRTPTRKAPKPSGCAAAAVGVGSGGLEGFRGVGGIEAAARRGTCEALGDLDVPSTADIVSGVVAGLGKSRLNISRDIGEFSRTFLTSLREANASLKEELKAAHAEGDAKDRRIADLDTKLADATASAHDWHLKAKELDTQLQAAKANEDWARSIVAHSVTRSAPPPQGSGSQGGGLCTWMPLIGASGCGLGKRVWVERGSGLACNACGRSIVHQSTCRCISCDTI